VCSAAPARIAAKAGQSAVAGKIRVVISQGARAAWRDWPSWKFELYLDGRQRPGRTRARSTPSSGWEMFEQVIQIADPDGRLTVFEDYLARHIEVDGEQHTPMAVQMLIDLNGDDRDTREQCADTVRAALTARARLWTAISESFLV
jgi:Protein of unknown function (DUF3050)